MNDRYDTLVVGAGFAGAVMAERLATRCGHKVLVIDRRPHIAGNAFDEVDEHAVLVHRYGPHLFHTNSEKVFAYLSRFTEWRPYEHRVLASVEGKLLPVPINRTTLNVLYDLGLRTDEEAEAFLAERAEPRPMHTSEDAVVAKVGRHLYETFFRGYTRKQWGLDPSELHASVTARIPVRFNTDDRYFTDTFQCIPAGGYTQLFRAMLDHPGITVRLGVDFYEARDDLDFSHLVFTGPIDGFFGRRFGPLPYRSLEFEFVSRETPDGGFVQPATQVNFPSEDVSYTRITEFRHIMGHAGHPTSTVAYEYSCSEGDPYYPIPRDENRALFKRYRELADRLPDVTFVGRLAQYQYLNMDQVTAQALSTFERLAASGRFPVLHPAAR